MHHVKTSLLFLMFFVAPAFSGPTTPLKQAPAWLYFVDENQVGFGSFSAHQLIQFMKQMKRPGNPLGVLWLEHLLQKEFDAITLKDLQHLNKFYLHGDTELQEVSNKFDVTYHPGELRNKNMFINVLTEEQMHELFKNRPRVHKDTLLWTPEEKKLLTEHGCYIIPVDHTNVKSETLAFIAALKERFKQPENPIALAAWAHTELIRIHPFEDGNGRVARAVANLILMKRGVVPTPFVSPGTFEKNPFTRQELSTYAHALRQGLPAFTNYLAQSCLFSYHLFATNYLYGIEGTPVTDQHEFKIPEEESSFLDDSKKFFADLDSKEFLNYLTKMVSRFAANMPKTPEAMLTLASQQPGSPEDMAYFQANVPALIESIFHKSACLSCLKKQDKLDCCGRCGIARYCSRECQVNNWQLHKKICKVLDQKNKQ